MQDVIYRDRVQAGEHLARELMIGIEYQARTNLQQDTIVLAIPRDGVIIGDLIASKFNVKLDIIVSRK